MGQQNELSPKSKKIVVIVIIVFILLSVVFFFFIDYTIDKEFEADKNNTFTLPVSVKKLIEIKEANNLKRAEPENSPVNFKKYIYLTYGYISSDSEKFDYSCDTKMNEKLNTIQNISASDVDGIILNDIHIETVGYYEKDDLISNIMSAINGKESKTNTGKEAMKICCILTYVSVPEGVVLQRDSIWGGEPPRRISDTTSAGVGEKPDDSKIINSIKNRIK